MQRVGVVLVLVVCASCGGSGRSPAPFTDGVVASFDPGAGDLLTPIDGGVTWAQTFPVPQTGTVTAIEVLVERLAAGSHGTVALYAIGANDPPAPYASLGQPLMVESFSAVTLPALGLRAWIRFDVSAGGFQTPPERLAIVVRSIGSTPAALGWVGASGGGYADGTSYEDTGGTWTVRAADHAFRLHMNVP